jgi:hypothetical protein
VSDDLTQLQQANAMRVQTLVTEYGVPFHMLQIFALQCRVEALVRRTVGLDERFELDDEQSLADVLEEFHGDLLRQRTEYEAQQPEPQPPDSGLLLPTTPGTQQAPSGLILPGGHDAP